MFFLDFMYLISYICQMKATDKKDSGIRELYFSDEFTEFYAKKIIVNKSRLLNRYWRILNYEKVR